MDVAELNARLTADIGGFLRNMGAADSSIENTRRQLRNIEEASANAGRALGQVKLDSAQAFQTAAVADAIRKEVSNIGDVARRTSNYLQDVKLRGAAAIETRLAAESEVDSLKKVERQAIKTRAAMGGGGGVDPLGINAIGTRGTAILAGVAMAIPVLPQLAAGTLGLGAAGAGGIGALIGGAAVLKLAFADITKQAFTTQKAFDKLNESQKGLVQQIRSLDAGLKTHLEHIAQASIIPAVSQGITAAMSPSTVAAITNTVQAFSNATAQAAQEWGKFIGGPFGQQLGQLLQNDAKYFVSINENIMRGTDILVRFLNVAAPLTDWLDNAASGAMRSADAWAQSAHGVQQMTNVMVVAKQGLTDVGHLLGSLFNALAALASATGSFNTLQLLSEALNEIASIVRQNHDVLRSFFAGAAQSVQDVLTVVRTLEGPLKTLLGLLNDVAGAIGGWRVVIDGAIAFFIAKMLLAKTSLDVSTTAMVAAIERVNVAVGQLAAALVGLGPAAAEGAAAADLAVGGIGGMAATASAEVAGLTASLIALGGGAVLGGLAALAFAISKAFTTPLPTAVGPTSVNSQTPGGAKIVESNGHYYVQAAGRLTPYTGMLPGGGYVQGGALTQTGGRDGMRGAAAPHGATTSYYVQEALQDAKKYGVPGSLFYNQIKQESNFDPTAVSKAGAQGIAQFMPATAKGMGVNPADPTSSLSGAARLMRSYYNKYKRWDFALAAYNGGPGAVDYYLKHGYYPSKETTNYVNNILGASGIPGGAEPGGAYGTPPPLDQTGMPKPKNPTGINLLPASMAARLTAAQTAALGFGGGAGGGGITNPGAAIKADQAVITDIQNALKYLDAKKQTVAVTREEHTLTQQLVTARRALASAEKTQQQNAIAAKERGILGIGSGGADATATILSLRAQAKTVGASLSKGAADGIDVAALQAQLKKINQVLKNNFVPPDVRQAITSQFQQIKQTIAQELADALADAKAATAAMQQQVSAAFNQIQNAADAAFQNNMQQHLNDMQVLVNSPLGQFLFGGSITQTPAGTQLAAAQEAHNQQQLQAQLKAAQDAVAKAHGGDGTLFDAATGIYSSIPGDPSTLAAAQQQLADAQYAIQVDALQKQDAIEQTAAQKQLADAKASYQSQQQLVQQAMDQQVQAIEMGMESGAITAANGWEQIKAIWSANGIDLGTLAFAMGGQIYVGLAAGLAPVFDMLKTLAEDLRKVAGLSGDSSVSVPDITPLPSLGNRFGPMVPMAAGGIGRAKGPMTFTTQGNEDFAFSGEGKSFGDFGGGGGDTYVTLHVSALDPESVDWSSVADKVRNELLLTARRNGNSAFGGLA